VFSEPTVLTNQSSLSTFFYQISQFFQLSYHSVKICKIFQKFCKVEAMSLVGSLITPEGIVIAGDSLATLSVMGVRPTKSLDSLPGFIETMLNSNNFFFI
jgi:hypothetical protein